MPRYDYDCAACGRRFEVIHGVHADAPIDCPLCGSGPVKKAISSPAVHFKGSGWAKKERRAAPTSKGDTSSAETSGDSSSTDSSSQSGEAVPKKGEEAPAKPAADGEGSTTRSGAASSTGSGPSKHAD